MIVLVTGGRNYADRDRVFQVLDKIHASSPITLIVQGGATGADRHAFVWASLQSVNYETFHAQWGTEGKKAGPLRNQRMVDYVHKLEGDKIVVAFPGGPGTDDCVRRAKRVLVVVEITDE
jgi:YspA, cpYpsA-related SLOG family